jgi:hypothetical protein
MWDSFIAGFGGDKQKALRTIGLIALGFVLVILVLNMLGEGTYRNGIMPQSMDRVEYEESSMPMGAPAPGYTKGSEYNYDTGATLSYRNVMSESMSPITDGYTPGDGEAFEVKNYSASIETPDVQHVCTTIETLKARGDVIFENSNEYDQGCSYTFKVEKKSVEEIYALIQGLDPKHLSENVHTIKRQVDDYTSEIDIYKNQLTQLDATLNEALVSYENITALATKSGDTESLAKIIESKLNLIERLTNSRLNVQSQLDRIMRSRADALDQLAYTYFTISVIEAKYVDGEGIVDSWKESLRNLVWNVNTLVQDITLGFVALVFAVLKYALYGILLLFVAKVGWKFVKGVWQG